MQIAKERRFLNCFDMAYQGFVSGNLAKDAFSVRLFAQNKLPMVVIQSFAKNFGLYGLRIGCISIPNVNETWVKNMNEMFGFVIRRLYSNNPRFGSDIVKTVLNDPELRRQWDKDIELMSSRMIRMRKRLYEEL
jgi:aspartate/tyrosine/aromatic aminotransferase